MSDGNRSAINGPDTDDKFAGAGYLASFLNKVPGSILQKITDDIDMIASLTINSHDRVKKHCFLALAFLARKPTNRKQILSTATISSAVCAIRAPNSRLHNLHTSVVLLISSLSVGEESTVAAAGAIGALIWWIRDKLSYDKGKAISALTNIEGHSLASKALIAPCGGIESLSALVRSNEQRLRMVTLFALIVMSVNSNDNKQKFAPGIISDLIGILRRENGVNKIMFKCRTVALLKILAVDSNNEKRIVAAGAVKPKVALILSEHLDISRLAIDALQNLSVAPQHDRIIATASGCIDALLLRARGGDGRLSRSALKTLMNLSIRCGDNYEAIAELELIQ